VITREVLLENTSGWFYVSHSPTWHVIAWHMQYVMWSNVLCGMPLYGLVAERIRRQLYNIKTIVGLIPVYGTLLIASARSLIWLGWQWLPLHPHGGLAMCLGQNNSQPVQLICWAYGPLITMNKYYYFNMASNNWIIILTEPELIYSIVKSTVDMNYCH